MGYRRSLLVAMGFFCLNTHTIAHEGGSNEHHLEGAPGGFTGAIELRPSWEADSGNLFGENTIDFGYRFSDSFQLGYQQEVHHNIAMQDSDPEHEGLGLHLETGLLKAHVHEVWESADGNSSLSLEPRIYLPTAGEDREKGFLTAGLCYLKFRHQLTGILGVTVMEAPTFFLYSVPGATVGEEFEANPTFQNRAQFALDVALFDNKLTLSLPLFFYLTRHADYHPGAEHNNQWTTFIGLAPEIGYELAPGFSTGFALVTPNLLAHAPDHSVNHGRTSTVGQLVMRASL